MKTILKKKGRGRRSGQVIAIMSLLLVVLLGFAGLATDYGMLVMDRNRLQRACDAGALAGASQLKLTGNDSTDTQNARDLAVAVAAQNGVTVNSGEITFSGNNTAMTVPASKTRVALFGRFLGITSKPVATRATAGVASGGNTSTQYVAPIGITWETYNAYKNSTAQIPLSMVRQNKAVFTLDDFVLFDLRDPNGKSGAHMQSQLEGTEIVPVSIGTFQTTLNAADNSQRNKLDGGLDTIFDRAAASPWSDNGSDSYNGNQTSAYQKILAGTMSRDNPRVLTIIITPSTTIPSNGTYNTEIQAFVQVYVESLDLGDKHTEDSATLNVRFLPASNSSDGEYNSGSGSIAGVRVVSLTS